MNVPTRFGLAWQTWTVPEEGVTAFPGYRLERRPTIGRGESVVIGRVGGRTLDPGFGQPVFSRNSLPVSGSAR